LTDLKEAQERLIQKERLVSLGHLASGIAHNLRTPIMAISGNIEMINQLIKEYNDSIADKDVTEADHHQIAEEMTKWINKTVPMLNYMDKVIISVMRQGVLLGNLDSNEEFSINELIENINILMTYELKKSNCILKIENRVSPDIRIKGQISALVQVLNNLIINSIHSYYGNYGEIELLIIREDNRILISVKDSGTGISGEIKDVIFKQMITTKGKDGTGIGLYVSYSTIKAEFSGEMWFETEKGKGTTFNITLPLAEGKV
jgi:signal transduction histidine kinase